MSGRDVTEAEALERLADGFEGVSTHPACIYFTLSTGVLVLWIEGDGYRHWAWA